MERFDQRKRGIEQLKKGMEIMMGMRIQTPRHFDMLRSVIFNRTGELLSSTTLKRIWGYIDEPLLTRESTLSILARSLGYIGWDSYLESVSSQEVMEGPSAPILGRSLNVMKDMKEGDILELSWEPGRRCVIRLMENCKFEVLESEKTRLRPGDTFYCHIFIAGHPLYLSDLRQGSAAPVGYLCGRGTGGISWSRKDEK